MPQVFCLNVNPVFFFNIRQSNVRPRVGSGIMAKPRSIMICQASLSEALTNDPRISSLGTLNHQGMPIGYASSWDTDLIKILQSSVCPLSRTSRMFSA